MYLYINLSSHDCIITCTHVYTTLWSTREWGICNRRQTHKHTVLPWWLQCASTCSNTFTTLKSLRLTCSICAHSLMHCVWYSMQSSAHIPIDSADHYTVRIGNRVQSVLLLEYGQGRAKIDHNGGEINNSCTC